MGETLENPEVDYEAAAATFDRRYTSRRYRGLTRALESLVRVSAPARSLEVGCGTGHWIGALRPLGGRWYGLDRSPAMLGRAAHPDVHLVRGDADRLPLHPCTFDLVLCVNALHQFRDPRAFVHRAAELLVPGGRLALAGLDAQVERSRWYLYEWFDGVHELDRARYPSWSDVAAWMCEAGLSASEPEVAESLVRRWAGRDVLDDPFLRRESTSQLLLLDPERYATGRARLEAAIAAAERGGRTLGFTVDLELKLVVGRSAGGGKD
jgi:SAM-dependent methyltransferase